jgi:threonine synthase
MNTAWLGYRCSLCGAEYAPTFDAYVCPLHGERGNLDIVLDYAALRARHSPADFAEGEPSLWRYLPLLPVDDPGLEGTPLRAAGWTPLYQLAGRSPSPPAPPPQGEGRHGAGAALSEFGEVWLKDDGRNPTASFKDRASAVVVARAREMRAGVVVTASTGNAGAALAGMAAAAGQPAVIFAPENAPPAKVAQLLIFGARVLLVRGNYDQAFDLSVEAAREFGWYCRNTGYNAFTLEGKKTAAYEICAQLAAARGAGGFAAPEAIFVSVGDGNIISGVHKGLKDLAALGWIEQMPRLFGVQALGSAACANAWAAGGEIITPVEANTLADSISVDLPRDGVRAVRAARETGGAFVVVSDDDILAAIAALGRQAVFAEPAGAAAYAGLAKAAAQGLVNSDETVVVLNTGSGLKDVRAARQAVAAAPVIEPTMEAVRRAI